MQSVTGEFFNGSLPSPTWPDWIGHLGFRIYRSDIPNLPRSLKGAGYRTGLIGKLHVNPASAFPFDSHKIASANFQQSQLEQYAGS